MHFSRGPNVTTTQCDAAGGVVMTATLYADLSPTDERLFLPKRALYARFEHFQEILVLNAFCKAFFT